MPDASAYDALILIARAKVECAQGRHERAVELLGEALGICEHRPELKREPPYLLAHVELYKIHRAAEHEREAFDHFREAVRLGATDAQLSMNDVILKGKGCE
jgi:tetratricopeptide (TPR) repeat protein